MNKKQEIIRGHLTCTCDEAYKSRNMTDPNCFLCEYESEIELMMQEYAEQQLKNRNLQNVMPSFLTHPYAQVICTNKGELNYVLEWAKQNGKEVSKHYYKVEKFPYHLFLAGDIVGWTDSANRVGDKFSFREFVDGVNWA